MPTYTSDTRGPDECSIEMRAKSGTVRTYRYNVNRCDGMVKTFSGPNEGRFIPGVCRINDMSASRTTYSYGRAHYTATNKSDGGKYTVEGPWGAYKVTFHGPSIKLGTWDGSLVGYAVQRAHAELISGDMDLGEFLAELPETISLVRGGVGTILKAIRHASRHNGFTWEKADRARCMLLRKNSLKKLPKKLANAWLTWRYGIRPLIWDVQNLIRAANSLADQSDFSGLQRRRGRSRKSSSDQFSGTFGVGFTIGGEWQEFVELEQKAEATVYFKYGAGFGKYDHILTKYGLHPNQFPYLLWQLRPLSFMLDWFVDVGTWVRAITPKWGLEIAGCSASQKTSIRSSRINRIYSTYLQNDSEGLFHDTCVKESIVRRRQTLSGEIPRLKPEIILSVEQQADLLSVLLQRALHNRRQ